MNVDLATGVAQDGEGGTDTLRNIEAVEGSDFDDTLTGDAGANLIEGGDGDDLLTGNAGDDTLDGDAGFDVVSYRGSGASVNVDLATGVAQDGEGGTDTLRNIEAVEGSDFDDTLTGDAGANLIEGGDGDDLLTGNAGDDTLDGGAGSNTLDYSAAPAGVNVNLAAGTASDGFGNNDRLFGTMAVVVGTLFADILRGDAAATSFVGNSGADTIVGEGGDDTLDGGDDDDVLDGGGGDDIFFGGRGADTITGGTGNDIVDGGALDDATDVFVLSGMQADFTVTTTNGVTTVTGSEPSGRLRGDRYRQKRRVVAVRRWKHGAQQHCGRRWCQRPGGHGVGRSYLRLGGGRHARGWCRR